MDYTAVISAWGCFAWRQARKIASVLAIPERGTVDVIVTLLRGKQQYIVAKRVHSGCRQPEGHRQVVFLHTLYCNCSGRDTQLLCNNYVMVVFSTGI